MGIFDRFKSKKGAEGAEPQQGGGQASADHWRERLRDYSDWEDEQKWPVAEELLLAIGEHLQDPRIKKRREDDEMELRGRIDDRPVRVQFEVDVGWVSIDMKAPNRTGVVSLQWDPEKVPIAKDEDDDWGEEDEELRVFVAKAVFVEESESDIAEMTAILSSLPQPFVAEWYAQMQQDRISRFRVDADQLSVGLGPNFYEMEFPVEYVLRVARLLSRVAATFGSGTRDLASQPSIFVGGAVMARPVHVTCSYCRTVFSLGSDSMCPNCGASYKA